MTAKKTTTTSKTSSAKKLTAPKAEPKTAPKDEAPAVREVDPAAVEALDVDDVTRCPLGEACAVCETSEHLSVQTMELSIGGVFCTTLCLDCLDENVPDMSVREATRRLVAHCDHLGTTIDVMHAKLRAETEAVEAWKSTQTLDATTS